MAKKIVRGITDVNTITNQDFDTNNVNDLLSDGQYNYIHRKKGETEEYHNLTDNIKTISSDNTELLSVTNYNKTTNTATLHPKHDAQKEQVLESTRDTIAINHGTNKKKKKTTVDTNPKKALEHEKLKTGDGLSTSFNTDDTTIMFKATKEFKNALADYEIIKEYPTIEIEKIADSDERINRGHAAEMVLFGHDIETTLASQEKVDGYINGEKLQLKASLISWKGTKNNGMGSATFVAA